MSTPLTFTVCKRFSPTVSYGVIRESYGADMLRAVGSDEAFPAVAYRVPWHVDERSAPWYVVTNVSAETARRACYQFVGSTNDNGAVLCGDVSPGGSFTVDARRVYPHGMAVCVMWRRGDTEYVWTFAD